MSISLPHSEATIPGDARAVGDAVMWRQQAASQLGARLRLGAATSAALLVAIFGWGSIAKLSGAVVAPGLVVIDSNSKKVQHQQGGIVGEILVKDRKSTRLNSSHSS